MASPFNSEMPPSSSDVPLFRTMEIRSFAGNAVTQEQLEEAAVLFRENYGIWGPGTEREGQRVALSPARIRTQYLSNTANTVFVRATVDGTLAGHAFACRWRYKSFPVCWITQLVVDRNFRNNGVATSMLIFLRRNTDNIYGIMSSHPAACLAAAGVFGTSMEHTSLEFIASHADKILKSSPISYIRNAEPHGTLFNNESIMVSGVNTGFFVDHAEPIAALETIKSNLDWPLGDLAEGHEFLFLLQQKRTSARLNQTPAV